MLELAKKGTKFTKLAEYNAEKNILYEELKKLKSIIEEYKRQSDLFTH